MPRPRSEQARQSVLAAMRRALAEDGYESVTIEGLAAEAGVAKQTIYRWWGSKAAILGEALLEGSVSTLDVAVPMTADLEADLRAWFAALSNRLAAPSGVEVARALIAVTATDPELGLKLNERLAAPIRQWMRERIRLGVETGEVRADLDAGEAAEQLLAMSAYAALLGRPLDAARVDAVVGMILRGIGG